jgi:Tfp pilus assembly protein PilV
MKDQQGISLLETIVALALLGIIGVNFLGATATTTSSRVTADEHNSARMIAESQMEYVKTIDYDTSYDPDEDKLEEYPGYTADIAVTSLYNGNLQKITITVSHHGKEITSLESYKTKRSDETS